MTTSQVLGVEDAVPPVRSRISWGAVFAGAVVALGSYFLLNVLGMAVGLTVSPLLPDRPLEAGAIYWAIATAFTALFFGGWVMALCEVGENQIEAVIHSCILWGLLLATLLVLSIGGIRIGFGGLLHLASAPVVRTVTPDDMRAAGMTPEEIARYQARMAQLPAEMRGMAQDRRTTEAAWLTLLGMLASLGAAVGGAAVGLYGHHYVTRGFFFRREIVRTVVPPAAH